MKRVALILAPLALAASLVAAASPAAPPKPHGQGLRLLTLARFDQPTFVGAPRNGGDVAYVTERAGRIRLLRGSRKLGTFLDLRRWVGCCELETGLFSVAFAPDYARSGRLYVYFTNRRNDIEVDQFRRSKRNHLRALPSSRRKIITINQRGEVNHNGVGWRSAPTDCSAATGDGSSFEDPSRASGEGARCSVSCCESIRAPAGQACLRNPRDPGLRAPRRPRQIYARGLRNPFRFSFDRGRILIDDVGQDSREEVDIESRCGGPRSQLRHERLRGDKRFRKGRLRRHDKPAFQYRHPGWGLLDRRRLRRPRTAAAAAPRPIRLRRLLLGEIRSFRPTGHGATGGAAGVDIHPGSSARHRRARPRSTWSRSAEQVRLSG